MGQLITNIAPTTETEAINAMLSAIGESPVADASTSTLADVQMAYNLLKNATRDLQSVAWRFNEVLGMELKPTSTLAWTDTSGATTSLNVFQTPTGVTQWRLTPCPQNGDLDMVSRPGLVAAGIILYDRRWNRDGADASRYPFIYIDALYAFDFEKMPETARRYCTVVAGRQFCQQVVGSDTLSGFQSRDEAIALRLLRRDQGQNETLNMLDSWDAYRIMGGRLRGPAGYTRVVAPGKV